ncbi:hypothetical protein A1Q1_00449 [Trichosporon asahii var. asahii CBS 2479]|uniref:Uncharacterized protein n=1 Tax=Trichosporon asahii var. asahii (strain ATCC 90039 / CBS 2479 / JCM 2466 / KCTC 7840 / NBRC 103889/ NCYC 2677 / UAMH 7654) TaxID=1186058 RepID=J5TCP1_TRIAS|nr:hypothetical protein A1Q1_00449 [Trichosporon asahii var. asahii CBS 2479]EJT50291.1 hypothetical protein A1Q1_00449 [Trichosporon asahii var. asahii CBS 2479]
MKVSAIVLGAIATTASAAALPFGDGEWKFPNIRIGYAGAHHDYGNLDKRGMMPCHQAHGAVQRSNQPSGLGRLLAHLGFDSYTVSRYEHHHKHDDGHKGHHKDHKHEGHHHGDVAFQSEGSFAPPPQDAEMRILPIFGQKADEAYAEKHVAAQPAQRPHYHGHGHGHGHGYHHPHAAAHRALSAVLYKLDHAGEAVTAFIRSLRFDAAYLIIGYIVGGALGFVAARKIRQARARRNAIRLDEETAAAEQAVVVDEKAQA